MNTLELQTDNKTLAWASWVPIILGMSLTNSESIFLSLIGVLVWIIGIVIQLKVGYQFLKQKGYLGNK